MLPPGGCLRKSTTLWGHPCVPPWCKTLCVEGLRHCSVACISVSFCLFLSLSLSLVVAGCPPLSLPWFRSPRSFFTPTTVPAGRPRLPERHLQRTGGHFGCFRSCRARHRRTPSRGSHVRGGALRWRVCGVGVRGRLVCCGCCPRCGASTVLCGVVNVSQRPRVHRLHTLMLTASALGATP